MLFFYVFLGGSLGHVRVQRQGLLREQFKTRGGQKMLTPIQLQHGKVVWSRFQVVMIH